jgi:hypothetical protein
MDNFFIDLLLNYHRRTSFFTMKAILAIALIFVAVVSAQQTCVYLEVTDTACEGHRTNWPTKVCNFAATNVSSAFYCDTPSLYDSWEKFCPLKNSGNASFCEGTGYSTGYTAFPIPCLGLRSCSTDDDCNPTVEPVAPQAPPPLLCYECCTFCFEDAECKTKVKANDTFTDSTTCTACRAAEPVAAPTSGNPTTPGTSNTPSSTAAVVVVSGTILAFVAALF